MAPNRRERGQRAEDAAIALLRRSGYRIVEQNFRCRLGEIDVVAQEGDDLVFVEVRSRASDRFGSALDAVTPRKQRQVARVAAYYLARLTARGRPAPRCRFDVVGITGERVELVRDAFRVG